FDIQFHVFVMHFRTYDTVDVETLEYRFKQRYKCTGYQHDVVVVLLQLPDFPDQGAPQLQRHVTCDIAEELLYFRFGIMLEGTDIILHRLMLHLRLFDKFQFIAYIKRSEVPDEPPVVLTELRMVFQALHKYRKCFMRIQCTIEIK